MILKYTMLPLIAILFLTACGPSIDDAKRLGFSSIEEMKSAQKQGFKNKNEFEVAEAKTLGFSSVGEMKSIQKQGYKSKAEFVIASAKSLGFASVEEMTRLQAAGYKTKAEFDSAQEKFAAFLKSNNARDGGNDVLMRCADQGSTYDKERCKLENSGKRFLFEGVVNDVKGRFVLHVRIDSGNYADVSFGSSVGDQYRTGDSIKFIGRISEIGTGILFPHKIDDARIY